MNDNLYKQLREMDISNLTLPIFFDNIIKKALERV